MRARRFLSYVLLAIALGTIGKVAYSWYVLADTGPLLEQIGAFRDPASDYKSLTEWEAALWLHLGLWFTLALLCFLAAVGLWAAEVKRWGWRLAFAAAALGLLHYAVVLAIRPVLWDQFLMALGVSLAVVVCYYVARKEAAANAF